MGDGRGPVGDEDRGRGNFCGKDEHPAEVVVDAHCTGQRRINKAAGESDVTARDGQEGNHLSDEKHDGDRDGAHERETHEQTYRARGGSSQSFGSVSRQRDLT